jgi:hypothetical protein
MSIDAADLKLDGNAVAGLLAEVFAAEMTAVVGTCAACGAVAALGAVDAYVRAPGVVLRCRGCDALLMCVVARRGTYCVSLMGIAELEARG